MSAYPPKPRAPYAADESPLEESATLYETSPYARVDAARRQRRADAEARRKAYGERHPFFFGTARKIRNPNVLTLCIIVLGFAYVFVPFSTLWSLVPRRAPGPRAAPNFPTTSIMPAQKTFTLGARTKGCHLVQSEVESELRDIIRPVKAGMLMLFIQHTSAALTLNENFDRDVRTDMDMVRRRASHRHSTTSSPSRSRGATRTRAPTTRRRTRRRRSSAPRSRSRLRTGA